MILVCTGGYAQFDEGLTNAELNTQKLFIEANQEKLLGNYDEAETLYQEVLAQDPLNDAAQYELARVYEAKDEHDKALEYINRAIRSSPDNEWYFVMKGDILEGMEEYAASIAVYEQLIALNPRQSYYYEHLVALLRRTNQLSEAVRVLDRHEQIAGVLPELIFEKVEILNELQRPQDAIPELQKLAALYPDRTSYLHRLAAQSMMAGDTAASRKHYQRILEMDPEDGKASLALATDFKRSGDEGTYLRSVSGLMANPAVGLDAKVLELIPFVEKYADNPRVPFAAELGEILSKLAAQYPREAKAHAIFGDFLYHGGDLQRARQEYEITLVLDQSVYAVWEQLMYLKLEQKDYDGVIATSEQALDVFPNQAMIYYLRGVAWSRKQNFEKASIELQQALIMSGRNQELQAQILVLLGQAYHESGAHDKCDDAFTRAAKLKPQDYTILITHARLIAGRGGSLDQAKGLALRAYTLSGDQPQVEHVVAWIAFRSGDLKTAREFIEKSMDHGGGDDYTILEHYGDILISMGETDMAIEHWQLSVERGNPSETLKRKIQERRLIH